MSGTKVLTFSGHAATCLDRLSGGYSTAMSDINTDTSQQQTERMTEVSGGPEPTASEEQAAEAAAADVDLDKVEENYRDMTKKGAEVEGEGDVFGNS